MSTFYHGSSGRIWTCDTSVNSRVLYHWAIEDYFLPLLFNHLYEPIPSKPNIEFNLFLQNLLSHTFRISPRPISTGQLHTLLHFHLQPIYLILSKGSYLLGYLILRGASRLDAFSVYPFPTWLPGREPGGSTGTPEVSPSRSSRTKDSSSQISYAHAG